MQEETTAMPDGNGSFAPFPEIHICNKVLYPMQAIRKWIDKETTDNN
jgi:hypothetical protein